MQKDKVEIDIIIDMYIIKDKLIIKDMIHNNIQIIMHIHGEIPNEVFAIIIINILNEVKEMHIQKVLVFHKEQEGEYQQTKNQIRINHEIKNHIIH